MPIPKFKFNDLTRTDVLQFDGVNFVNVPVYAVGKNVMWGPEGVGYNSLIVGDVTKNIPLVNHKHTTDDILGLQELINDLGVNSNSGTNIDLSKYLLTSTFIDHLNNIGSAKHVTQAHLDKLNSLNNYWQLDEQGNLYTTYNTYSTQELSAYGLGDEGSEGGSDYERLDTWASYDSSKTGWVLSAFLGNDLNTRVTDLENSAGGGGSGSVTSVGISVPTGLSVSNSPIISSGVIAIGLQDGYSIPATSKQAQWNIAYNDSHTHENKTELDLITQSNIEVLSKLSIVNGNLQINGNAYATGELSAYGVGASESGVGASYLYELSDVDPSVENAPENSILKKIGTHWKAVSGDLQPLLVSGTNIATINGQNLLNGGNILIEAGGTGGTEYILPTASASTLGGVKIGTNVSILNGTISVHNPLTIGTANGLSLSNQQLSLALATTMKSGALSADDKGYIDLLRTFFEYDTTNDAIKALKPFYSVGGVSAYGLGSGGSSGGGTEYILPIASASTLGGIKVGQRLSINNGILSADDQSNNYSLPTASATTLGGIKVGNGLTISSGVLSVVGGGGGGSTVAWGTESGGYVPLTVEGVSKSVALSTHTHTKAQITDFAHTHLWVDITNKPSTFTPSAHTHSASDISSGTFAIARIPTGTTSLTVALGNHTHSYLPLSGGTLTGDINITPTIGTLGIRTHRGGISDYKWPYGNSLSNIRTGLGFGWRDTEWIIGNIRDGGTGSYGFGIGYRNDDGNLDGEFRIAVGGIAYLNNVAIATVNSNVASATKLETSRTIWGQSFDGTGNVTGELSGATTIDASISVTAPKIIFAAAGWSLEQTDTELQMKYNGTAKLRFLSGGSIVAAQEITAYS